MKLGQFKKLFFFTVFFQLKTFFLFSFKFLNIVCPNQIQLSHSFYKKQEKIANLELSHQKNKKLDECSSILKFFLLKYVHISIWLADIVFNTLTKNTF